VGEFGGYRPLPVALSGLLALAVGGAQAWLWPEPGPAIFLGVWVGVALVSLVGTAVEMALSLRHKPSVLEREKTWLAVSQFAPCLAAGVLLLAVLAVWAPEALWMLPGLWAMFFGLGVFASWRFLPAGIAWVGAFYVVAGVFCIVLARGEWAFSPWAMALPFGVGQLFNAAILYRACKRPAMKAVETNEERDLP
jgi:hypothetical protein